MAVSRSVLAVGGALFVLAGASMLDSMHLPEATASARGDRLDVAAQASRCSLGSFMAACADEPISDVQRAREKNGAMIQEFERSGETILVRVKLGD